MKVPDLIFLLTDFMANTPTNKSDKIIVKGARVHNLKNIDIEIPRDSLVVFTGLSGSGKSSLAFDTIYAEGQRRFMETLSAYARQFIGGIELSLIHIYVTARNKIKENIMVIFLDNNK